MNQVTTKPATVRQAKSVAELLSSEATKANLAAVMAKHLSPSRFIKVIAKACRINPKLANCEPMSMMMAMSTCAELGLEPNTPLGHAYLIPYEDKKKGITTCQLQIGYQGLIALARRSGQIATIHADVVTEEEYASGAFDWEHGSKSFLRHKATTPEGKPAFSYAYAKMTDGGEQFVVLPWSRVMAIRNESQGYKAAVKFGKKDSPWMTHERAMASKTAIRALAKYLPMATEMIDAITHDTDDTDDSGFAFDPGSITIEGSATVEPDPNEGKGDEKPGEASGEAKPAAKGKGAEKAEKATSEEPTAPAEEKSEDEASDPQLSEIYGPLIERIASDLGEVTDPGEVEATLDLFSDQLAQMREAWPEGAAQIDEAADEARERLAGSA